MYIVINYRYYQVTTSKMIEVEFLIKVFKSLNESQGTVQHPVPKFVSRLNFQSQDTLPYGDMIPLRTEKFVIIFDNIGTCIFF